MDDSTSESVGRERGVGTRQVYWGQIRVRVLGEVLHTGWPFCSRCFYDFPHPPIFSFFCGVFVCVFVWMSKSALHWPDPGCCTRSPVSPAQARKVVDAQPGRFLPFSRGSTLCDAQTLRNRAHCSPACILQAPPAHAELKSLCWGTAAKSDAAIWRCPAGRSW